MLSLFQKTKEDKQLKALAKVLLAFSYFSSSIALSSNDPRSAIIDKNSWEIFVKGITLKVKEEGVIATHKDSKKMDIHVSRSMLNDETAIYLSKVWEVLDHFHKNNEAAFLIPYSPNVQRVTDGITYDQLTKAACVIAFSQNETNTVKDMAYYRPYPHPVALYDDKWIFVRGAKKEYKMNLHWLNMAVNLYDNLIKTDKDTLVKDKVNLQEIAKNELCNFIFTKDLINE